MSTSFLFTAIVFLLGAVICVPLAKRFGLSSVLGYLLGGILIGPYLLGFVGEEGDDILHFAEFGVVMMLFLIGLEIEPKNFWKMRKAVFGMGGAQVIGTMLLTMLVLSLFDLEWRVNLVISMAMALSSTAIILQTLKEKGLMNTVYGQSSFSILLFQDIIVIVMLAIVPLLSDQGFILDNLPLGLQTLAIISSVVLIILSGRYLIVPMLRLAARTRLRELLTASALLIVLAISFLMELVGISPALGAFLGGVVLANSEFKHELESTLEPFKGLLLGLFFMAVGASINFIVIREQPSLVTSLVLGVILLKALVLFLVGWAFKLKLDQRLLMAIGLAQIGEFAFVLLSFAFQLKILEQSTLDIMLVVTTLTMAISPIIGMVNERLILPRVGTKESEQPPMDAISEHRKVILVGFGHFGSTVGRFLRVHGVFPTILDNDAERVDTLRKMGFEVFYGDATRVDLLESAGINEAQIIIIAVNDPDTAKELAHIVQDKFPHVKLVIRARNRYDAYALLNMGVEHIYRETLDTSVSLAADVLNDLGFRKYTIHRQALKFIKSDVEGLKRLAKEDAESDQYIFSARKEIEQQEKLLEDELKKSTNRMDRHWDSDLIRLAAQNEKGDELL
ncbi:UNVERIFIED_CONTAM: hypothetical protein GTU68_009180 [Idotea baltica]|nr:hypothetical protein [Idotea baltica]